MNNMPNVVLYGITLSSVDGHWY